MVEVGAERAKVTARKKRTANARPIDGAFRTLEESCARRNLRLYLKVNFSILCAEF